MFLFISILTQFIGLAISLGIAYFVRAHYRDQRYPIGRRYSTFWPRFWTGSIDSLVFWPIGAVSAMAVVLKSPAQVEIVILVIQQLAWAFYSVGMHAKYGQTVGKMVCKVKVLDAKTEAPITFVQALLTDSVPIVLSVAFLPWDINSIMGIQGSASHSNSGPGFPLLGISGCWFLLEVLTMLTNDKRRALHDFIAGTIVVRTNAG